MIAMEVTSIYLRKFQGKADFQARLQCKSPISFSGKTLRGGQSASAIPEALRLQCQGVLSTLQISHCAAVNPQAPSPKRFVRNDKGVREYVADFLTARRQSASSIPKRFVRNDKGVW
jgi:hypothetical protein